MSLVKIISDSNKPIGLSLFLPESFRPYGILVEALDSAALISSMLAHVENLLERVLEEFTMAAATRTPTASMQGTFVCRGEVRAWGNCQSLPARETGMIRAWQIRLTCRASSSP